MASAAVLGLAVAAYIPYALSTRPGGGTTAGLAYGTVGFAFMKIVKVALLVSSLGVLILGPGSSTPAGQRPPSVSSDLAAHPKGTHRHRVIVQANDTVLTELRRSVHGLLRRDLAEGGAVALEVTDAELDALQRNPLLSHISGDLPVNADM